MCRHFVPTPFRLPIPIFNFGGERGIRTPERIAPLLPFQGSTFDRSAISPCSETVQDVSLKIYHPPLLPPPPDEPPPKPPNPPDECPPPPNPPPP